MLIPIPNSTYWTHNTQDRSVRVVTGLRVIGYSEQIWKIRFLKNIVSNSNEINLEFTFECKLKFEHKGGFMQQLGSNSNFWTLFFNNQHFQTHSFFFSFLFFFLLESQNVQMSSKITIPSPTLIFLHNVTQKELILSYAHYILRTRGGLS